jgi:hypothetical protein
MMPHPRRLALSTLAVLLATLALPAAGAEPGMKPFAINWSRAAESVIDFSGWLDAPAGAKGFIKVDGARMATADGRRFRVWGVNLTGGNCFPAKELAPLIAADLARMGVNCVRFHHMDAHWAEPNLFEHGRDDTRHLSADAMDRFDFLVAELKKRGIYSNLNLNVHRAFRAGDGVRDFKILGAGKGATYFNARLIELQQEFARQLLTHRNPYTNSEYRYEPAVAAVEIVNENSLTEAWAGWRLVGRDDKAGDTWSPIPASYAEELTDQYNAWLARTLKPEQLAAIRKEAGAGENGRVPRLMPDGFAKASKERFGAEAAFLMETEQSFFAGMKKLLKDELGVKSLLIGSADHNDGISGYPHGRSNMLFDVIDGHGYWQHPTIAAETWIKNTPMVNDPLDSTVVQFARTPVAGRPFTISETNHPYPHRYACEGFPILTAYALLHDWDGIYWFDYGAGRRAGANPGVSPYGWFEFSNDPVKATNLMLCAAMWYRQDLRAAGQTVARTFTPDQVRESLRLDQAKERPFFTPGFARSTPLQHATRWALDETPGAAAVAAAYPPAAPLGEIVADTKQLGWFDADKGKGLVTIDAERTQGLVGFVNGSGKSVRHLSADVSNEFCSIVVTSLDGQSIAGSSKLLLTTTARTINTDAKWKDDGQTLTAWGRGPALIEPVAGRVTLRELGDVKAIRVRPLTAEGRPMTADVAARGEGGAWVIPVGEPVTTWYVIELSR